MTVYLFAKIKHDHLVNRRVSNNPQPRKGEIHIGTQFDKPTDYFERFKATAKTEDIEIDYNPDSGHSLPLPSPFVAQ